MEVLSFDSSKPIRISITELFFHQSPSVENMGLKNTDPLTNYTVESSLPGGSLKAR